MKPNQDLRQAIRDAGVYSYAVAETMGISTTRLCQIMQRHIPDERRAEILAAIEETAKSNR